ncbi:MAG: ATPase, T2SS/T4P/T4SS family [Planctomycetota bacterium]|nr:ATPase, T2SS/T4P/T4SS family [Planctomycetota bacterium]
MARPSPKRRASRARPAAKASGKPPGKSPGKPDAAGSAPHAPTPGPGGELVDLDEAVALLDTTRPTFYRWVRAGRIKGMKVGRQWRFYRADIDRFLKGEQPRVEVSGDLAGLLDLLAERLKARGLEVQEAEQPGNPQSGLILAASRILLLAHQSRASDVHIDPPSGAGDDLLGRIRFRLDGVLHPVAEFDARLLPHLIERFKVMAGCDVQTTRRPQDGRMRLNIRSQDVDVRACFVPALRGEAATLRILRNEGVVFRLDQFPLSPWVLAPLKAALAQPAGLVLITGPTGSGKTTTLYAALQEVTTPGRKVMTFEDPVEYALPGTVQVPINVRENLTFPAALRSALRSDPDVMMVGELRDNESLQIVAQAVLTGHLVLSSMHTNDAASALTRLADIGLDRFMIGDVAKLVVAQRLVRVLCKRCSQPAELSAEELAAAERNARAGGLAWEKLPKAFRKAAGCDQCNGTGFRGRQPVNEALPMSPALASALKRGATCDEMRKIAADEGMITLGGDAIARAAAGVTTLDEALRVMPEKQRA